jgi:hypothetical protein
MHMLTVIVMATSTTRLALAKEERDVIAIHVPPADY